MMALHHADPSAVTPAPPGFCFPCQGTFLSRWSSLRTTQLNIVRDNRCVCKRHSDLNKIAPKFLSHFESFSKILGYYISQSKPERAKVYELQWITFCPSLDTFTKNVVLNDR